MAGARGKRFTHDHVVGADGSVAFACSQDMQAWPWLAIGAIQAASYWLSVESAMALGGWDPDKWSALTWTHWTCGDPRVGRMAHGRYERVRIDGKDSFAIHLYDAGDALVCHLDGRGVVFRTRDFETWRSGAKAEAATVPSTDFAYAERALLGIEEGEFPFLGPRADGRATGLLDAANAMPPAHPWLDGSGDHVNSAHLAEVARQFVSLLRGGAPFRVIEAEMRFAHYVEMGVPFEIEAIGRDPSCATLQLRQAGRACTQVEYRIADA